MSNLVTNFSFLESYARTHSNITNGKQSDLMMGGNSRFMYKLNTPLLIFYTRFMLVLTCVLT